MFFPQHLNILINQGSTFELPLALHHAIYVRCGAAPSATPLELHISPSGVSLPAGAKIPWGCGNLILAAPLLPADDVMQITKLGEAIPVGTDLAAKPIDVTGWSGAAKLRSSQGALLATFDVTVGGNDGIITTRLSAGVTAALPANCRWPDLAGWELSNLGVPKGELSEAYDAATISQIKKIEAAAYLWDLETTDTAGAVQRRCEGYTLVGGEVTY
jgi:hypothetical protein